MNMVLKSGANQVHGSLFEFVRNAGLALGAGLAYAASRLINSEHYDVAPDDPLTLALAARLLVLTALSATYLPARRASRLDPMAALRQE